MDEDVPEDNYHVEYEEIPVANDGQNEERLYALRESVPFEIQETSNDWTESRRDRHDEADRLARLSSASGTTPSNPSLLAARNLRIQLAMLEENVERLRQERNAAEDETERMRRRQSETISQYSELRSEVDQMATLLRKYADTDTEIAAFLTGFESR